MTPNTWEVVEIGLAIYLHATLAPEGHWHTQERLSNDEFARFTWRYNIVGAIVENFELHTKTRMR
jgi:hypothetical protein